jgi:chemotaxis protein methyltransferase CheR
VVELVKLSNEEFAKIAKVVYDLAGIHLPDEKLGLLSNRLRKRLRELKLASFSDYHKLISSKAGLEEELPHFLSAVTTNETYFFRNEQLWKFFCNEFIPDLIARKGDRNKSVRIWSAASSSGEESYTTAISLREHLPNVDSWSVSIVGSDISAKVLEKARNAIYNDYAVSKMPPAQIDRWFTKLPSGEFQLKDAVRKMVKFQFHNLKETFPAMC